eukprot:jgi/Botrbrau1/8806/Bobra.0330s0036.1
MADPLSWHYTHGVEGVQDVEQITLPSPLAFSSRVLEQAYQKHGYRPGINWLFGLGLGFLTKAGLLASFMQAIPAQGSLAGLVETVTAFLLALVMFYLKQFRPAAFHRYWQVMTALHFVLAVHSLSFMAPLVLIREAEKEGILPAGMDVRAHLALNGIVPFMALTVGSSLPFAVQAATAAAVIGLAVQSNAGYCTLLDTLPMAEAASFSMKLLTEQLLRDAVRMVSPCGVAKLPERLPREAVMLQLQVWVAGAASLLTLLRELRSRRRFVLTGKGRRLVTELDAADWAGHPAGLCIFALTLICSLVAIACISWYCLVLSLPVLASCPAPI